MRSIWRFITLLFLLLHVAQAVGMTIHDRTEHLRLAGDAPALSSECNLCDAAILSYIQPTIVLPEGRPAPVVSREVLAPSSPLQKGVRLVPVARGPPALRA